MIKRIIKGLRYSDRYGNHPGHFNMLFFAIISIMIMLENLFFGIGLLLFFLSLYLFGAYERGK